MRFAAVARGLIFLGALLLWGSLILPQTLYAQMSDDAQLHATIRAAILSDPRTAEMSEAKVDAMVVELAIEARTQGLSARDITWRPQEGDAGNAALCGGMPLIFCSLNQAFGFDGSDVAIPIGLAVSSALLLFLIGSILLHHHGHHIVKGRIGVPVSRSPGITYGE